MQLRFQSWGQADATADHTTRHARSTHHARSTLLDTTVWTGNAAQKRVSESERASINTDRGRVCQCVNLANVMDCVLAMHGIQAEQSINNEAPPLLNNVIPFHHDKKILEC